MKRVITTAAVMGFALMFSNSTFATQGRGQGRGSAGARPGSNPGNRPTNNDRSEPPRSNNKDFDGFKNYGQYVAARHVSENLGIRFADLRSSMVGGHRSLGEAIHALRPDLNKDAVKAATKKAEAAAKQAEAKGEKKQSK
jgi:hypothetical protein